MADWFLNVNALNPNIISIPWNIFWKSKEWRKIPRSFHELMPNYVRVFDSLAFRKMSPIFSMIVKTDKLDNNPKMTRIPNINKNTSKNTDKAARFWTNLRTRCEISGTARKKLSCRYWRAWGKLTKVSTQFSRSSICLRLNNGFFNHSPK